MTEPPHPNDRHPALDDASFPGYAMSAAAAAIGVTPAFLRSAEAAGLFAIHRTEGGHRRYSRDDLQRATAPDSLSTRASASTPPPASSASNTSWPPPTR